MWTFARHLFHSCYCSVSQITITNVSGKWLYAHKLLRDFSHGKKKLKSHHNWHFFVLTLVVFIILFFRINRIFCYSNSQYSYLKKNVRNFWKTVDLLLTIIFGQRTFFSSIKLVFQGKRQFYLFYYDTIFKYRVLFKKAQSSIEIDIIVVKKL